jgi:hypothetical protein
MIIDHAAQHRSIITREVKRRLETNSPFDAAAHSAVVALAVRASIPLTGGKIGSSRPHEHISDSDWRAFTKLVSEQYPTWLKAAAPPRKDPVDRLSESYKQTYVPPRQ